LILLTLFSCNEEIRIDQINKEKFCDYFQLKGSQSEYEGQLLHSMNPEIIPTGDPTSRFIRRYHFRFDYLINKLFDIPDKKYFHIDKVKNEVTVDSILLSTEFCNKMGSDSFFRNFSLLIPADTKSSQPQAAYTNNEMMLVASRFFYVDQLNEKDTSTSSHICIGINGIHEIVYAKDLTALEAFCFEAIFHGLDKRDKFLDQFRKYQLESIKRERKQFTSFDSYLSGVRNRCYNAMEHDASLQTSLMKYYKANKNNLNFTIE